MDKPSLKASWDFFKNSPNRNDAILKSVLLSVLMIVPLLNYIVAFVALDYKLQIIEFSKKGEDKLPELNTEKLGDKIINGLKYYLVILVYSLPVTFVILALVFVFLLPMFVLPAIGLDENLFLFAVICMSIILTAGLTLVSAFWNSYILLPATHKYMKRYDIGDAFKIGELWNNRKKTMELSKQHFVNNLVINIGFTIFMILSALLLVVCIGIIPYFIGIVLSYLYGLFILPHYEGKIYKIWDSKEP